MIYIVGFLGAAVLALIFNDPICVIASAIFGLVLGFAAAQDEPE